MHTLLTLACDVNMMQISWNLNLFTGAVPYFCFCKCWTRQNWIGMDSANRTWKWKCQIHVSVKRVLICYTFGTLAHLSYTLTIYMIYKINQVWPWLLQHQSFVTCVVKSGVLAQHLFRRERYSGAESHQNPYGMVSQQCLPPLKHRQDLQQIHLLSLCPSLTMNVEQGKVATVIARYEDTVPMNNQPIVLQLY